MRHFDIINMPESCGISAIDNLVGFAGGRPQSKYIRKQDTSSQ